MAGPRCPHQRHGCRGVADDGAVTSRAEIIRHAVRLVGSLSPSRVQACLTLLWPHPTAPLHDTHTENEFVYECRREAGRTDIFA
jgi:hypothetical protein